MTPNAIMTYTQIYYNILLYAAMTLYPMQKNSV